MSVLEAFVPGSGEHAIVLGVFRVYMQYAGLNEGRISTLLRIERVNSNLIVYGLIKL